MPHVSFKCVSCPSNVTLRNYLPWECDNCSTWFTEHGKLAGAVRILAGVFVAPELKCVPPVSIASLNVPLNNFLLWEYVNWPMWLTENG